MKFVMSLIGFLFIVSSCKSMSADNFVTEDDNSEESLKVILDEKDEISEEEWWKSFNTGESLHNLYKGTEIGKDVSLDDLQAAADEEEKRTTESATENKQESQGRSYQEELEEDLDLWNSQTENVAMIKPDNLETRDEQTLEKLYKEYTEKLEKEVIRVDHHRELLSIWERQYASVKSDTDTLVE